MRAGSDYLDQQIHGASVAGRRVSSSSMFVAVTVAVTAVTAVRALMRPPLHKFVHWAVRPAPYS